MTNRKQQKSPKVKKEQLITHIGEGVIIDTVLRDGKTEYCIFDRTSKTYDYAKEYPTRHATYHPIYVNDGLIKSGSVVFPSGPSDYESKEKLIEDLVEYIYKYVDVPMEYVYICAYYAILTHVFENFHELPYVRVLGDYGSGKSRLLKVLGHICFNPVMLGGGASLASIFRIINDFKGTLIIDEADFSNTGTTSGIIKVLNTGYQKGNPIVRVEGDPDKKVQCYDVFGPKIVGGRNEFSDKATESRCLTNLMKRSERTDIPTSLGEDFLNESRVLRNKLLKFRHDYLGIIFINTNIKITGIEPRLKQIIVPLLSIIDDEDAQEMIIEFMKNKQQDILDGRRNGILGGILTILRNAFIEKEEISYYSILQQFYISDSISLKPVRLGYLFKENGLITRRKSSGKVIRYDENEKALKRLYETYGTNDIEEAILPDGVIV